MSLATPIPDGTYYISSQISSTFITLIDAAEGTNVTAWMFDGSLRQQVLFLFVPHAASDDVAQWDSGVCPVTTAHNISFKTYNSEPTSPPEQLHPIPMPAVQ